MSLVMNYCPLSSSLSSFPSSSPKIPHFEAPKCRTYHYNYHYHLDRYQMNSTVFCSLGRHHRRRRRPENPNKPRPSPLSDQKVQMVIDIENLSHKASLSLRRLLSSSELKFHEFVHNGYEALEDLQTLVAVDSDRRIIVSCRRSTVLFVGNLVLWSCVIVFAYRVLVKLGLGSWGQLGFGNNSGLIWRRDRSLGGREVVVARKSKNTQSNVRVLKNPLSIDWETASRSSMALPKTGVRSTEKKLPSWWPVLLPPPIATVDKEKYQRMANRFIRAIMDNKISGRDISEDDIVQFRRLCRTSGARVSIDIMNARDSFYRASVYFVFNVCCSAENQATVVLIDGEDARHFVAGLANNIGLENAHAARIVSAAVAAHTRSCFVQAWALEMQGKHSEALLELSKICPIHRIFPPEECSPEMEMVARSLEKHLKVEEREFLMDIVTGVCGKGNHRSIAEALGLVPLPERVYYEPGNKLT